MTPDEYYQVFLRNSWILKPIRARRQPSRCGKRGTGSLEKSENLKEFMLKEVDLVQEIIKRMAGNSFAIKGWAITLVVATLLLQGVRYQVLIAFIPLIVFWFLDAYFLWQERLYRELYNWIINNRLKTDEHLLDLNAYRFKSQIQTIPRIMFSVTLGWFYGSTALLTGIYSIYLFLF